jgi:hypothetical protein
MNGRNFFIGLLGLLVLLGSSGNVLSAQKSYRGASRDYTYIPARKPPYRMIPARRIAKINSSRESHSVAGRETVLPQTPAQPRTRRKSERVGKISRNPYGKLMSVSYQQTPLREIINEVREELRINVVAYWPEMGTAGYSPDTPVTLELEGVPAITLLNAVTNYVSAGTPEPLGWTVNEGILTVNLKKSLPGRQNVRVYYVGDLVAPRSGVDSSILIDSGRNRSGSGSRSGAHTRSNRSSGGRTSGRSGNIGSGDPVDNAYLLVDTIESALGISTNSPTTSRDR